MSQLQQTGEIGEPTPRRRRRRRRAIDDEKEENKMAVPEPGALDMYNINSREAFGHSRSNVPINNPPLNYGIAINNIPNNYGRYPLGNVNEPIGSIALNGNNGLSPNNFGSSPNNDSSISSGNGNNGLSPTNGSTSGGNGLSVNGVINTSDGPSGLANLPFLVVGIESDLAAARSYFRQHSRAITECLGVLHNAVALNIDPRYLRDDLYQTLNAIAQAAPSLEEGPFTALSN